MKRNGIIPAARRADDDVFVVNRGIEQGGCLQRTLRHASILPCDLSVDRPVQSPLDCEKDARHMAIGGIATRRFAMFGLNRWNSFDDVFNFQREMDRVFNQFWTEPPSRTAAGPSSPFQVNANEGGWRVDVPLPGVDPNDVSLEAAGNHLTVRRLIGPAARGAVLAHSTIRAPQLCDDDRCSQNVVQPDSLVRSGRA